MQLRTTINYFVQKYANTTRKFSAERKFERCYKIIIINWHSSDAEACIMRFEGSLMPYVMVVWFRRTNFFELLISGNLNFRVEMIKDYSSDNKAFLIKFKLWIKKWLKINIFLRYVIPRTFFTRFRNNTVQKK